MSAPAKRLKLVLNGANQLYVPEAYEFPPDGVVPFQGIGVLLDTQRKPGRNGVEIVTYRVGATEITLLGPTDAARWIGEESRGKAPRILTTTAS